MTRWVTAVNWLGDLVEEGPGLLDPAGDLSSVPTTSGWLKGSAARGVR
jgi:hypothetical protein